MMKWHELTWDNIGQWPVFLKISFILSGCFFIGLLGYALVLKASWQHVIELQAQEFVLKKKFVLAQKQWMSRREDTNQILIMQKQHQELMRHLPMKNEIPGLLEELTQQGIKSGLKFELFAPQTEITHDFYLELPIKMTLVGTYMQLTVFIKRVARMSRMVTFHDMTLIQEKQVMERPLTMNVMAKIYRYRLV